MHILTASVGNFSIWSQLTDGPDSSRNRWNKRENAVNWDLAKSCLSLGAVASKFAISFSSCTNESRWVASLNSFKSVLEGTRECPLGYK